MEERHPAGEAAHGAGAAPRAWPGLHGPGAGRVDQKRALADKTRARIAPREGRLAAVKTALGERREIEPEVIEHLAARAAETAATGAAFRQR